MMASTMSISTTSSTGGASVPATVGLIDQPFNITPPPPPPEYVCNICGAVFPVQEELDRHKTIMHPIPVQPEESTPEVGALEGTKGGSTDTSGGTTGGIDTSGVDTSNSGGASTGGNTLVDGITGTTAAGGAGTTTGGASTGLNPSGDNNPVPGTQTDDLTGTTGDGTPTLPDTNVNPPPEPTLTDKITTHVSEHKSVYAIGAIGIIAAIVGFFLMKRKK